MRSAMTSMALATASACEATAGTTLPSSAFIKWTNSMAVSSSRLAESGFALRSGDGPWKKPEMLLDCGALFGDSRFISSF